MGLSSLLHWLPYGNKQEAPETLHSLSPQKWQTLANARRERLPIILYSSPNKHGQGYQSMILKLNQKHHMLYIDMPCPSLPSDAFSLPKRLYLSLRQPGAYRHWHVEGCIIERAIAQDGPYLKLQLEQMSYREDRRYQQRFSFKEHAAEVSCTPPMEQPIYGNLDNISIGGICFHARGNLQHSDAFCRAYQNPLSSIPVNIQLNKDDALNVKVQILAMQTIKKPYLHTCVRAKFTGLNEGQAQILAALAEKSYQAA